MSGPLLHSARLLLRPCVEEDVEALHALWVLPEVRRWLWDDVVIPEASARDVVRESRASFAARGYGHWVLADRRRGALIGAAGLRPFDGGRDVELLYALVPARWGEGFATEAARAILDYAFGALALPRVAARLDSPNVASKRVLERLGLDFEGERLVQGRPTLHYGIGRERYEARADGTR